MRSNKRFREFYIVGKGNQTLQVVDNLSKAGTGVNMMDGQIGVINVDGSNATYKYGDFIPAGTTANDVPEIAILQGTPNSINNSGIVGWFNQDKGNTEIVHLRASDIHSFSSNLCTPATRSAVLLTNFTQPITNDTNYHVYDHLRSGRKDKEFGRAGDQNIVGYSCPTIEDFTDPLDHLLQHLLYKYNVMSKAVNGVTQPSWAVPQYTQNHGLGFGINLAGGAGVALGTIALGTVIPIQNFDGTVYEYVADKCFIQTVYEWTQAGTGITAASTIELIDLTTAGDAAKIDAMVFMGLDHDLAAAYDDIYGVKVRIEMNLGGGFLKDKAIVNQKVSDAYDNLYSGRVNKIRFDRRAYQQTGNDQLADFSDTLVPQLHYIDPEKDYTVYTIEAQNIQLTLTDPQEHNVRIWILLECIDDSDTATGATGITPETLDVATVADLNAVLGVWLESIMPKISLLGDATPGALFV